MRKLFAALNPRLAKHEEDVKAVEERLSRQERVATVHEKRLRRLELELGVVVPEALEDLHAH